MAGWILSFSLVGVVPVEEDSALVGCATHGTFELLSGTDQLCPPASSLHAILRARSASRRTYHEMFSDSDESVRRSTGVNRSLILALIHYAAA